MSWCCIVGVMSPPRVTPEAPSANARRDSCESGGDRVALSPAQDEAREMVAGPRTVVA